MPMGVSSPEIHSWCWEQKAVVTIGFTAPAPQHQPLGPNYITYVLPDPDSCFTAPHYGFVQDQTHTIPSLLFGFSSSLSLMEILVLLSYLVIPRHPPDSFSGVTVAAISSPLA